jgi:hypothetical protein
MTIYQHFTDPLEAKRLFLRLGQMDAEGYQLWEALMGWVVQDYPGTWHDWCERQRENGRRNSKSESGFGLGIAADEAPGR